MKTSYAEMFPDEFKAALNNSPIAYLPLGSIEYHGYQNVLGLDSLKAFKICTLATERLVELFFPRFTLV